MAKPINDASYADAASLAGLKLLGHDGSAVKQVPTALLTPANLGAASSSHTHASSAITDFAEAVQDVVAAFSVAGTGILKVYDDAGNTLTWSADPEYIRDTIGTALQSATGITVTPNDGADTIAIAVDSENLQDQIAAFLAAGANITITYNDGANTLTVAGSGGSPDDIDVLTPVTSPSSPWTMPNGTGSRFVQVTTSGALTVNKTTNGFTSGLLQVCIVRYVASGGDITITHGSGISVGQGVAITTIPNGTYRDIVYQTRDGATAVYYDGDPVLYAQVDLPLTGQITDDQAVADPCPFAEWIVPARYNGWKVKAARVEQSTAGTTNASTYMPFRVRSGTPTDLCTANISVASAGTGAAGTVQTSGSADVLNTGDRIRVEIVGLSTTKPKGGSALLEISNA